MALSRSVQRGELEFELVEHKGPALLGQRSVRPATPHPHPAFASVGMQAGAANISGGSSAKHVPAFVLASTVESRPLSLEGVPQWRITAGNLAAGATAGCTVEAALYPIDTIKTRLQAMRSGGGIRVLLQAVLRRVDEQQQFLGPLTGGVAAGLASSLVRVPTEVVKTRMQTGEFAHAFTALRTILAKEGQRGIFAGYGSFLLRDLPFDAIEFVSYEAFKMTYQKTVLRGERDLKPAEHSVFGAVAGAFTGLVTTPLDVLKTRLMLQGASGQYKGVVDCATKIIREEGPAAMFRGWEPRVIWIGIGGSIFFTALEASKRFYAPRPLPRPRSAGKKDCKKEDKK